VFEETVHAYSVVQIAVEFSCFCCLAKSEIQMLKAQARVESVVQNALPILPSEFHSGKLGRIL